MLNFFFSSRAKNNVTVELQIINGINYCRVKFENNNDYQKFKLEVGEASIIPELKFNFDHKGVPYPQEDLIQAYSLIYPAKKINNEMSVIYFPSVDYCRNFCEALGLSSIKSAQNEKSITLTQEKLSLYYIPSNTAAEDNRILQYELSKNDLVSGVHQELFPLMTFDTIFENKELAEDFKNIDIKKLSAAKKSYCSDLNDAQYDKLLEKYWPKFLLDLQRSENVLIFGKDSLANLMKKIESNDDRNSKIKSILQNKIQHLPKLLQLRFLSVLTQTGFSRLYIDVQAEMAKRGINAVVTSAEPHTVQVKIEIDDKNIRINVINYIRDIFPHASTETEKDFSELPIYRIDSTRNIKREKKGSAKIKNEHLWNCKPIITLKASFFLYSTNYNMVYEEMNSLSMSFRGKSYLYLPRQIQQLIYRQHFLSLFEYSTPFRSVYLRLIYNYGNLPTTSLINKFFKLCKNNNMIITTDADSNISASELLIQSANQFLHKLERDSDRVVFLTEKLNQKFDNVATEIEEIIKIQLSNFTNNKHLCQI